MAGEFVAAPFCHRFMIVVIDYFNDMLVRHFRCGHQVSEPFV